MQNRAGDLGSEDILVRVHGLGRTFGAGSDQVVALRDATATFRRGEVTVVIGPSGCGKSTLLNLLGVLDRPTSGVIRISDIAVSDFDRDQAAHFRRRHVGFLFQDGGLIDGMTAVENVALPLLYQDVRPSERRQRATAALADVMLADRADDLVGRLSGGERQRVALCRATIARPALLVCDEPTAPLDEDNSRQIAHLLQAYARSGRVVICSTHDPSLIGLADHTIRMQHGRVVHESPVA